MIGEVKLGRFASDIGSNRIEGCATGSAVSVIVVDIPPGEGPALHRHPYAETLVVLEGRALLQTDEQEIEVAAGTLVAIPAHVVHGFKNLGPGRLRQVDIHASDRFITDWVNPRWTADREPRG